MERNKKGQFVKGHEGYDAWSGKRFSRKHREKISERLKGNKNAGGHIAWNRGVDNRVRKDCQNCGKVFYVYPYRKDIAQFCSTKCRAQKIMPRNPFEKGDMPWNKGLAKETDERVKKMSDDRMGEKNWMWRGGTTKERDRFNRDEKKWREKVFKRDDYTCQKCKKRGGYLVSHHIRSWAIYPKLRFVVSNGITFCEDCHKEFHRRYGYKNNRKQLKEFLFT